MFVTRVERNFEAAHTNGPPGGKCYTMHGHSWQVTVDVQMPNDSLDEYGWTIDFTKIKAAIDRYDHQTLNEFFEKPSAEYVAMRLWDDIARAAEGRATDIEIKISEGHGNTLIYTGPDEVSVRGCGGNCGCGDEIQAEVEAEIG